MFIGSRNCPYLPMEGYWKFQGVGGLPKPVFLRASTKLNWNFQRGGGSIPKMLPWEAYGHFLEQYIKEPPMNDIFLKIIIQLLV